MFEKILLVFIYMTPSVLSNTENLALKVNEGILVTTSLYTDLVHYVTQCFETSMYNEKFLSDNVGRLLNAQSKTTVGFAPKFTNNRKFFANLINTVGFKDMLANDIKILQNSIVDKLKYCDLAIMDQNFLKEFYDREVDPNKI